MKSRAFLLSIIVTLAMSLSAQADVPDQITYQGRLLYNGNPVTTATIIEFRLYQTSSGGSTIWTETHGAVTPDSNGIYTEVLGGTTAIPDDYDALWLELVVAGNVLTPRKRLTSAPFVLRVGELPNLYVGGSVGIGTAGPTGKLQIQNTVGSPTIFDYTGDNRNYIRGATYFDSGDIVYVAGNVGIGATSVFGKLDVKASGTIGRFYTDTSASGLQIKSTQSSTSGWLLDVRKSANSDGSGGTQVFGVREDGNVGIGTLSPSEKLEVNGMVKASNLDRGYTGYGIGDGSRPNRQICKVACGGPDSDDDHTSYWVWDAGIYQTSIGGPWGGLAGNAHVVPPAGCALLCNCQPYKSW